MKQVYWILHVTLIHIGFSQNINWVQMNGPYGGPIRDFVETPSGTIFVCSEGGVYRTRNSGIFWEKQVLPKTVYNVISTISYHPSGVILAFSDYVIFRSTNDGAEWKIVYSNADIRETITDSAGVIFAASYRNGFMFSTDAGLTWETKSLIYNSLISLSQTNTGKILCGSSNRLYISNDWGTNWDSVDTQNMPVYDIACRNNSIYVLCDHALLKSTDKGITWQFKQVVPDYLYRLSIDFYGNLFVATTFSGIQKSIDEGDSWTKLTMEYDYAYSLFIPSKDTIFIGHPDGISFTSNGGDFWERRDSGLVSLAIGSILENVNGEIFITASSNIYSSLDNGRNWVRKFKGKGGQYGLVKDEKGNLVASENGGLVRSTDHGNHWSDLNISALPYFFSSVTIKDTLTIFAGTSEGRVFRTTDGGLTWNKVLDDSRGWFIDALAVDGNGNIYCGTLNSVFKSSDNGKNWMDVNDGTISESINKILCLSSKIVIVGSFGKGIFISHNGGDTWNTRNKGIEHEAVMDISTDRYGNLYCSGVSNVYFSSNQGENWTPLLKDVNIKYTRAICITSERFAFFGTQENGLYRSEVPLPFTQSSTPPFSFSLSQNYPNPFNSSTTIQFSVKELSVVSLKIYDITGREIQSLVDELKAPGEYFVKWNAAPFPSGVYFYTLKMHNKVISKKLVLLK